MPIFLVRPEPKGPSPQRKAGVKRSGHAETNTSCTPICQKLLTWNPSHKSNVLIYVVLLRKLLEIFFTELIDFWSYMKLQKSVAGNQIINS